MRDLLRVFQMIKRVPGGTAAQQMAAAPQPCIRPPARLPGGWIHGCGATRDSGGSPGACTAGWGWLERSHAHYNVYSRNSRRILTLFNAGVHVTRNPTVTKRTARRMANTALPLRT